jgi:dienelactone hydrolase
MFKRFDKVTRQMAFTGKTPAEFRAWRKRLVAHLKDITGYSTMLTCPLKPKITQSVKCDGYIRQRVEIQTEPGVVMPFFVLIPDGDATKRRPAVICPHGHCSGGKLCPAGIAEVPGIPALLTEYNYDYGVQYAKAGLIAFCPDARGFGERQERYVRQSDNALASSCQHLNQMAYPLGQSVTGMWAWDLHRLVDYIQSRADCDPTRIGCAGLSGGGLQTLWAAALDDKDRIGAAVVSGYFYGYRESLLDQHANCSCNYVPRLYEAVDMGDLGALIAPRPLLIETGDKDPLNGKSGLKNVNSQVAIARKAYRVLGASDKLVHDVFEGGHKWHGTVAVPFIKSALA